MGLFIELEIDQKRCVGIADCGKCVKVCPVQIFAENENRPESVAQNEDECTLCELCFDSCEPGALAIRKLYE